MAYSFTQIEEDKTKTIRFVFIALIAFYFVSIWIIAAVIKSYIVYEGVMRKTLTWAPLDLGETLIALGLAAALGYGHWQYTVSNLVTKILGVLRAEPINESDHYHRMFGNIVEEVSVATGGKKMEAVIVPSSALNAFAVADFSGRSVIGVTEGLLARLTRSQIEAVVGHEAAHIVSGDCLATTITSSLFELYSGVLKGFELMLSGATRGRSSIRTRSSRGGGGAIAMILIVYLLLHATRLLSQGVRMFISRQREFRADAIAVRLTRDPLSLAEALYGIKYHWRGAGLPAQELEAIFIVNPKFAQMEESSGALANLFSTHPPMEERLGVLMKMAHTDAKTLISNVESKSARVRIDAPNVGVNAQQQWVARKGNQWQGPFNLIELTTLGWLNAETWIKRAGDHDIKMAYQEPEVSKVINAAQSKTSGSAFQCPRCQIALQIVNYEGVESYKCGFCQGILVGENDIKRIIIRQDVGFSDKIKAIAQAIIKEERSGIYKVIDRTPETMLVCPKCQHKRARMMRMFYTETYRVEIDKCFTCGFVWFDSDELEVLQYLIENATQKV